MLIWLCYHKICAVSLSILYHVMLIWSDFTITKSVLFLYCNTVPCNADLPSLSQNLLIWHHYNKVSQLSQTLSKILRSLSQNLCYRRCNTIPFHIALVPLSVLLVCYLAILSGAQNSDFPQQSVELCTQLILTNLCCAILLYLMRHHQALGAKYQGTQYCTILSQQFSALRYIVGHLSSCTVPLCYDRICTVQAQSLLSRNLCYRHCSTTHDND